MKCIVIGACTIGFRAYVLKFVAFNVLAGVQFKTSFAVWPARGQQWYALQVTKRETRPRPLADTNALKRIKFEIYIDMSHALGQQ